MVCTEVVREQGTNMVYSSRSTNMPQVGHNGPAGSRGSNDALCVIGNYTK